MEPIIIIGSGLAGYTLAREMRKLDKEQDLIVITGDNGEFYSKPMISNALANNKQPNDIPTQSADDMANQLNAEILTKRRVEHIDIPGNLLGVEGRKIKYSRLVLAVGAQQIPLPIDGREHCHSINNLDDYRRFVEQLQDSTRLCIIGSGLIGCEFANDLAKTGRQVELIGRESLPLQHLLPEAMAELLKNRLQDLGIRFHLDNEATAIQEANGELTLELKRGVVSCDMALSAIGLRPNLTLAQAAGIQVDRGIKTDGFLRTNAANVYALGDCAQVTQWVLPYVLPLMQGARALAKTLCGEETAVHYPSMPVVIKTPACPLVVAPPPKSQGNWTVESEGDDLRALYHDSRGKLTGFALSGALVKERMKLNKELPDLIIR